MSDSTANLAFLIDSPMMSWGASSRFNHRETEAYPTKSALIGMIAAAMGIDKHAADESEALAPIARLQLTVLRLDRHSGRMPLRLSDFHTVGGGYNAKDSAFSRMSIPRKASGGPSANAVITHRSYLTEACFIALFHGSRSVLDQVSAALLDPQWGVWFGRKNCIPASPLSPVIATRQREALADLLQKLGRDPAVIDALPGFTEADGSDAFHPMDQPLSFGRHHAPVPEAYQTRPSRRVIPGELT